MKVKQFLQMGDISEEVEITKDKEILYSGNIEKYLKTKKVANGNIKSWSMCVENWDYPIMQIEIEQLPLIR